MNGFQIAGALCGGAIYLLMLGCSVRLIFSPLDPEVMFGGIFLTLIILGATFLAIGAS